MIANAKRGGKRGSSSASRSLEALAHLEEEFKIKSLRDLINFVGKKGESDLNSLADKVIPSGGKVKEDFIKVVAGLNRPNIMAAWSRPDSVK